MDMALIRLTPPDAGTRHQIISPQLAVDILWAAVLPGDRLEHITARAGPRPSDIDLALFHRTRSESEQATDVPDHPALRLCRRAIQRSPALTGWNVTILPTPPAYAPPG